MKKGHNWGLCRKCGQDHGQPLKGRRAWWVAKRKENQGKGDSHENKIEN